MWGLPQMSYNKPSTVLLLPNGLSPVALRCVGRFGFGVAVPATLTEGATGAPYPFGALNAAAP